MYNIYTRLIFVIITLTLLAFVPYLGWNWQLVDGRKVPFLLVFQPLRWECCSISLVWNTILPWTSWSSQKFSGLKLAVRQIVAKEQGSGEVIVRTKGAFHLMCSFSEEMEDLVDHDDQMNDPPLPNVPDIRKTFCDGLGQQVSYILCLASTLISLKLADNRTDSRYLRCTALRKRCWSTTWVKEVKIFVCIFNFSFQSQILTWFGTNRNVGDAQAIHKINLE